MLSPYVDVIRFISNRDATAFFQGKSGERLFYWSRAWAARALAYLDDDGAADWLVKGLEDEQWRVRMTAAQTLGRLYIEGYEEVLSKCLSDPHPRVRAAVAVALGRTGNKFALDPLQDAVDDEISGCEEVPVKLWLKWRSALDRRNSGFGNADLGVEHAPILETHISRYNF